MSFLEQREGLNPKKKQAFWPFEIKRSKRFPKTPRVSQVGGHSNTPRRAPLGGGAWKGPAEEAPEDTEEAAQSGTAAVEGEEEGQTAEEEAEAEAAAEELEQEEEQQEEEEAQGHEEGTEAQVPEGEQQEAAET